MDNTAQFVAKIRSMQAYFDGRIVRVPADKPTELVNHQLFRNNDCSRNAISSFARHVLRGLPNLKKRLYKKNSTQMIALMLEERKFDYATRVPPHLMCGVYAKKETYQKEFVNPKTKETGTATRTRIANKSFRCKSGEHMPLMCQVLSTDKYWPADPATHPLYSVCDVTPFVLGVTKSEALPAPPAASATAATASSE
jgi:hypothetical protein